MSDTESVRPAADEYNPYYESYVSLVPRGDVVETLRRQIGETVALLKGVSEERAGESYAPGKWSVKELVGHVADAERIFSYRALAIARGDTQPLPGMDQEVYARGANFNARTLQSVVAELEHVRAATLDLVGNLDAEAWARRGVANENEVSVRALAYMIAGHEAHHMKVLRERYLLTARDE